MRDRFISLRAVVLSMCLAACAAQTSDEDNAVSEPQEELEVDRSASTSAPVSQAHSADEAPVPGAGEAAPRVEEADVEAPALQPRIFGVGTSCTPNSCRNGGECMEQWLGFTCKCLAGFSGSQCQNAPARATCGNRIIERAGGEDCEVGVGNWSNANCSACRQTVYTPQGGQVCMPTPHELTSQQWLAPGDCPGLPGYTPTCLGLWGAGCYVACNNDSQCPAAYRCFTWAQNNLGSFARFSTFAGYCR